MFISNLDPIAFTLGPVSIRWYGLLFSSGFIIGYFIMQLFFRKKGYKTEDLDRLLFYIFIGTIIGARLAHCLIYEPDYYLANPVKILEVWEGGLASHGGCLGVIIATLLFLRKCKYRFLELADMLSVPTALVCSMIRLGNFFNSEIVGNPTNSDFGVVFLRLGETFPRHPAQLYEASAYLLIFIVLLLVYKFSKKRPEGFVFGLFFTLAFTARILVEPFKVEQADYESFIKVGQLLSIPFVILGVGIIIYSLIKNRKNKV
ncbi:MAG: prolipoprotein diacylglyceryl transferase [Succinivibrio sp.]